MRIGGSVVITTVKPDDAERAIRQAERAGRGEDVRVFRVGEDTFNPLAFEQSRGGSSGARLESLVSLITLPLERQRRMGTGGDPHWKVAAADMCRNLVIGFDLAGVTLSYRLIYETITTLPSSIEEVHDPAWQARCPAYAAFQQALAMSLSDSEQRQLDMAARYLLHTVPTTPHKTMMSIVQTLSASLGSYIFSELGDTICADHNTWSPDELIDAPQVFILDIPTQLWGPSGETLQRMLITSIQREIIRRRPDQIVPPAIMLSMDEYPQICDPEDDLRFMVTGRDRRSFMCVGTQSIGALRLATSDAANPQSAEAIYGATAVKFLGATSDVEMMDLCSRQFSAIPTPKVSFGSSQANSEEKGKQPAKPGQNYNFTIDLQPDVPGHEFLSLMRGGPENNYLCEFFVAVAGRTWNATGKSSLKLAIRQRLD